ncbi:tRNA 2-thiouridine(34) synthase MnmA [uncultured Ruminococcus sp.]|uniref:tRNA 2-thiouridine(34) synthase MnmA n=1 Tax=uncultured Ruminococcus sp. TaxID=165186 RepID=UPI0025F6C9CB|nr:tRNA 2-thiouridine(34) synthase MnmA [uncultured Ruminococcus sp.]
MAKKALIAMSGGVDSSVAAYLIKEQGFEATGITLKLFDNEDIGEKKEKTCCSLDDIDDARNVCYKLGIPYYVYNFKDSFKENVISRFISAYENGTTPNPCIDCNRYIKFEKLMRRAEELEFDYVVTGHYAVIEYNAETGRYLLKKSADSSKDQSYVLYSLTQKQLAKTLFPLGNMTKEQTREIAEKLGLINAHKHDSQDICFVPDGDYAKFIEQYTGRTYPHGNFVDESGKVLGEHKGIIRYTVGQRKGLGLALPHPMYVKKKDLGKNEVILCENSGLFSRELYATDINLITCDKIDKPIKVKARVRYNQSEQSAVVEQIDDNTLHIVFDEPQRAISYGQAVVLYDGDYVVGGGTICRTPEKN